MCWEREGAVDLETLAMGVGLMLLMLFTIYQTMNIMGTVQTLKTSVEKTVGEVSKANRQILASNALLNKTIERLEKKINDLSAEQKALEEKVKELSKTSIDLKKSITKSVKMIDMDVEKMLNMTKEMREFMSEGFENLTGNIKGLKEFMNATFDKIIKELRDMRNETKSLLKYIISKNIAIEEKLGEVSKRLERLENATYEALTLMERNYKEMRDLKDTVMYNTRNVLQLKDLANKTYTSLLDLKENVNTELESIKESIAGGMEKLRTQLTESLKEEVGQLKAEVVENIKGQISSLRGSLNTLNTMVTINMVLTVIALALIAAKIFNLI